MTRNNKLYKTLVAALLCGIGIIIPIISPIKITLEPASFTLASHVTIFISMFISPVTAVFVSVGTTLGFLIGGFPIVVVLRAATHLIFAFIGSLILKKYRQILNSTKSYLLFSLGISILHGILEVIAVLPFYFNNTMSSGYYAKGFVISVLILVGAGTVVHSMVDFYISQVIWKHLTKAVKFPGYVRKLQH